jgi:type I site-specific restriction endonuclease
MSHYDKRDATSGILFGEVQINIFNISKINSEVRGGRVPRIKRLSEYIGESYFDYLAYLEDLVLIMDESHRYRASAGVRAINELKPVLGLELTATPFVETSRGAIPFKNVIYDYPLAKALADGFVKEPAVVTQRNFDASQFTPAQLEEIKLQDGIRLHENTKVELDISFALYAAEGSAFSGSSRFAGRSGTNRGMGKTPASCKASRQAQAMSSWLGTHFCRYQGRWRRSSGALIR